MKTGFTFLVVFYCAFGIATASAGPISVTGQWDFKQGDLRATIGADLQYLSNTAGITAFPVVAVQSQNKQVMAFGSNSVSQGFYMRHGADANGGGQFVNQYTLIMDVMFPTASSGQLRALFQTDPFNHAGNDAEYYIGSSSSAPDANGLGADGQFNGSIAANTWYRIAFAVDLTATNVQLTKYINGTAVGAQALSGGFDGRYALGPTALLFTAGLTNGGCTQPGYVSGIQFFNGCLTAPAIAALGSPTGAGMPSGQLLIVSGPTNSAHPSALRLNWGGAKNPFAVQLATNLTSPIWQNVGNLDTTGNFYFSPANRAGLFRVDISSIASNQLDSGMPLEPDIFVGTLPNGNHSLPTKQILQVSGQTIGFSGRPVDIALSPDGKTAYIKNLFNLQVMDVASWKILQTLTYSNSSASMHGMAVSRDGSHIYVTGSAGDLYEWAVATNRTVTYSRTITLPYNSDPCGIGLSPDGTTAYVCLGTANAVAVADLIGSNSPVSIRVGMAPYDIAMSSDGSMGYVSDWAGRVPRTNDLVGYSAGSYIVVDSRGIAASGVVSVVNLSQRYEVTQIPVGLHPSGVKLSQDGNTLFVANANSDTVTVIDTQTNMVKETILVRPDPKLPFGSAPNALALSPDGKTLYAACGGNNGVAVVELPNAAHTNSLIQGFVPTDWYPGAVATDGTNLYVANANGRGSTNGNVYSFLGTANKIPLPSTESLSKYTARVQENGRVPQVLQTSLAAQPGQTAVPVPRHTGEPSVFKHVLYIVKENKTYDQIFGDIPSGNGLSNLCIFPQSITPNHHALAAQYVLLDNFYCNGVYSNDGHSWISEGNATDYWEKSMGGYLRSGSVMNDPLMYSSSGFIWDNVLQHGLTFHNYGFTCYSFPQPSGTTWRQVYTDYINNTHAVWFTTYPGSPPPLQANTSTNVSGFNFAIPDQVRLQGFLQEFESAQSNGVWPAFNMLYLPNDHTVGTATNFPTPSAMVADNDLALGKAVMAVTLSRFWSNTVIFVIEDDPQGGYDHVDGHRSICLVISPYTKRGQTVSTFYNQTGMLHTMEQIMGLPPMNQLDAMGPLMTDCFTTVPDYTPYFFLPNNIPLDQMNPGTTAALTSRQRYWARLSQKQDFSKPDAADDDALNRIIWYSVRGNERYPAEWAGPHGKGLKKLGLALAKGVKRDDDD